MKVNINQMVRVKLTEAGERVLNEQWLRLRSICGNLPEQHPRKPDSDGMVGFQLWDLMERFGPHISMAGPLMFETTIDIVDEAQQ